MTRLVILLGLLVAACDPELPPPGGAPVTDGHYPPLPGAMDFCARNPEVDQCRSP